VCKMKRLTSLLCVFFISGFVGAATLVIEGKYQNKNVYVQNGFVSSGVGFCAKEIKVNGKITTDETNSSAFEIDLNALQLKYGEKVTIEILHTSGCVPKVLNIDDLRPRPTFEMLTMNVSSSGLLTWKTENESGSLPYVIEQFKWNKWVPVGEVTGVGTSEIHEYSFQVSMHSGENKYRLKQKGLNALPRLSKEVIVLSYLAQPSFAIPKNRSSIDFSAETAFEIYDVYGVVVKKGYGKQIITANLKRGNYYVCYDNTMSEFKK
jgi:hypothetical protein